MIQKQYDMKGVYCSYENIFLVNGRRTPFGKFCGSLATISPTDLGILASKAAIKHSGLQPSQLDQAIIANVNSSCLDSYFLPRHIALYSGLSVEAPALLVQRICGSGFETIINSGEQIVLGKSNAILCCGTENLSLAPTVSFGNRMGYPLGSPRFYDMLWEAFDDTATGYPMGHTGENVAKKLNISRTQSDEFALLSIHRALKAGKDGVFDDEIIPVTSTLFEKEGLKSRKISIPKKTDTVNVDEHVRETDIDRLGSLPAVYKQDGVLTAGNSCGIVDGAAAVVVASLNMVKEHNLNPLCKIMASTSCGIDPKYMGLGPVPAINLLLHRLGLRIEDIGLFEINEAFSSQIIGCEMELGIDRDKLNIHGGAIALGHPYGATGVRLCLTLANSMVKNNVKYGIASACIGGGQGTAVLLENTNA